MFVKVVPYWSHLFLLDLFILQADRIFKLFHTTAQPYLVLYCQIN